MNPLYVFWGLVALASLGTVVYRLFYFIQGLDGILSYNPEERQ